MFNILVFLEGLRTDENSEQLDIAIAEIESMQEDQRFLWALQDAGVDNWPGYDYACEEFHSNED